MAKKRTETPVEEDRQPKLYTVTYPHGVNLRAEPSKEAAIIKVLPCGATVTEQEDEAPAEWMSVEGGYVMREFLG